MLALMFIGKAFFQYNYDVVSKVSIEKSRSVWLW